MIRTTNIFRQLGLTGGNDDHSRLLRDHDLDTISCDTVLRVFQGNGILTLTKVGDQGSKSSLGYGN